ncbi:MAG: hemerythrin domain-containing protein [Acidimicrobiia bacterium]
MTDVRLPEQEHARAQRIGLRTAIAALAAAAGATPADPTTWVGDVVAALGGLRSALSRHVEFTESPDGLFADVRAEAPQLINAIRHLETEHDTLAVGIEGCETLAGAPQPDGQVAAAAQELVRRFELHVHRGAELVYDAYNVDINAAD